MELKIDTASATLEEITTLRARLEKLEQKKQADAKQAEIKKILEAMEKFGITVDDLANPKSTRQVKAVYRHPDDPKLEWAGRGKKPDWVQALEKEGRQLVKVEK